MMNQAKRKFQDLEQSYIPQDKSQNSKEWKKWTKKENEIYVMFLEQNKEYFETQYLRRAMKVFKGLSQVVKTKTQSQCKSHHQKMMKKFDDNIDKVIIGMKKLFDNNSQAKSSTKGEGRIVSLASNSKSDQDFFDLKCFQYFEEEIFDVILTLKDDGRQNNNSYY